MPPSQFRLDAALLRSNRQILRTVGPSRRLGAPRLITTTRTAAPLRDLPNVKAGFGRVAGLGGALLLTWGGFVLFAMNEERLSSSVVKRVLGEVSTNESTRALLGDGITLEPAWYLLGTPRIGGQINLLQGNVDIKFRIKGSKGGGTVYFSSIRRAKGEKFEILRFKVITDDGRIENLSNASMYY